MHYHAEVWIPHTEDIESQVAKAMEPDEEHGGFWDWYQVGGRWKGAHAPDYDPEKDRAHMVKCDLCNGTGVRPGGKEQFGEKWFAANNGCNGCQGKGEKLEWPTQWQPHEGDVMAVREIQDTLGCHTLVTPEGIFEREVHNPDWDHDKPFDENRAAGREYMLPNPVFDGKVAVFLRGKGVAAGYLVTVDYHN